jgi:hypothetical protein
LYYYSDLPVRLQEAKEFQSPIAPQSDQLSANFSCLIMQLYSVRGALFAALLCWSDKVLLIPVSFCKSSQGLDRLDPGNIGDHQNCINLLKRSLCMSQHRMKGYNRTPNLMGRLIKTIHIHRRLSEVLYL